MKKQEMITLLRSAGVDENAVTLATNAWEMGAEWQKEEYHTGDAMRQALELALEALEDRTSLMKWQIARDAVKEALAQPEQEPISFGIRGGMAHDIGIKND
jgi:hypothetical protein